MSTEVHKLEHGDTMIHARSPRFPDFDVARMVMFPLCGLNLKPWFLTSILNRGRIRLAIQEEGLLHEVPTLG